LSCPSFPGYRESFWFPQSSEFGVCQGVHPLFVAPRMRAKPLKTRLSASPTGGSG
jgi:hypothetical protein